MKYLISFFWILILTNLTKIDAQNWSVSQVILGSTIEPKYSVIDNQNNLYTLSFFSDTIFSPYFTKSFGSRDLFLTKFSPTGNVIWYKRIGSDGFEAAGGITIDNSNNIEQ